MRVLIADDHPVVRHGLKQILALDPGLELVGEAKNGNEALELARKLEWDVAVLDYSMPGRAASTSSRRSRASIRSARCWS